MIQVQAQVHMIQDIQVPRYIHMMSFYIRGVGVFHKSFLINLSPALLLKQVCPIPPPLQTNSLWSVGKLCSCQVNLSTSKKTTKISTKKTTKKTTYKTTNKTSVRRSGRAICFCPPGFHSDAPLFGCRPNPLNPCEFLLLFLLLLFLLLLLFPSLAVGRTH